MIKIRSSRWAAACTLAGSMLMLATATNAFAEDGNKTQAGKIEPAKTPEQAPLAKRTGQSGLPLSATQVAMDLPHLTLSLSVDPSAKTIAGTADYTVQALSPLSKVEFDLDPRLPVSKVTINGKAVASTQWSNPDGGLVIRLPRPLKKGQQARVAITYGGTPFVAPSRHGSAGSCGAPQRMLPDMTSHGSPPQYRDRVATCSGRASIISPSAWACSIS
ncbi:hypothetical protein [Novosphingobium sp. 9]|uniref:hypothetical protein n=1 Tax=Novosphingobium sp. 9 TaxID=2025349 RepID=UPI0021B68BF5|nr:hypothetical protein [Novosphingobium sp. 9]